MTYPITAAAAWHVKILAEESGEKPFYHLPQGQKDDLTALAAQNGVSVDDLIETIANQGDDKDRRIARLEGSLIYAEGSLGAWLSDNTEEVFEEQSEIDGIRSALQEVLYAED